MSDDGWTEETTEQRAERLRAIRVANMAKARAVRDEAAREAQPRTAQQRTIEPRTAADVGAETYTMGTAQEAAQQRGREAHVPEETLTRRPRHQIDTGRFDIPSHRKRPGWDYQFIAIRVLNQPVESADIRAFREQGWRPVRAVDIPEMADEDISPDAPIEVGGQRLYTRPMSLTQEARAEDLRYAQQQQMDRMLAAASGRSAVRGEETLADARRQGVVVRTLGVEIEGVAG